MRACFCRRLLCLRIAQVVVQHRGAARRRHLVDRRHAMAGADVTGVHLVVVEVFTLQGARLVADQPVFGDRRRVELHLQLDVLGDREERRACLLH
ncbi:hypothetical protein D9M70_571700 [compost metagenome]